MTLGRQFHDFVIVPFLAGIGGRIGGADAAMLIARTGAAESGWRAIRQSGYGVADKGGAFGFCQIEIASALDHWQRVRNDAFIGVGIKLGILDQYRRADGARLPELLMGNVLATILTARLVYWHDSAPVPPSADLEAQAAFWKRVYNTRLGAGTIPHFTKSAKAARLV